MIIPKGDLLVCPACGEEESDPVEDYVVPGQKDGMADEHRCGNCDYLLLIIPRNKGQEFEVLASEEDDEI